MEIKIIETVTTIKETSLIDKINSLRDCRGHGDPELNPTEWFFWLNGFKHACREVIDILEKNELILK